MQYSNPIILQDFSDPDVIRVEQDFYMIASSFNFMPGVPILHSKNLVDWQVINYVYNNFPLAKYDEVHPGHGAWAPSLRYHNGTFYAFIPTPDEGIFVAQTNDIWGKWDEPRLIYAGKGLEDPCPIWVDGKCYVVHGYVKSRCGFNSMLGMFEMTEDLSVRLTDSVVIYDGHDNNPTIEGPKFNYRNGYFYILAPAGGVTTGWQTCLRSKNIYGPYESKIILMQGHSDINGPHQGALFTIDDNDNWAFIHFQDQECYGRVIILEPVLWHNDWPLPGRVNDLLLAGEPVRTHDYLLNIQSDYQMNFCDDFQNGLNIHWQTPANPKADFYKIDKGLILTALNANKDINYLPNLYTQKIAYRSFKVTTKADLSSLALNSSCGFGYLANKYYFIDVKRETQHFKVRILTNEEGLEQAIYEEIYSDTTITFNLDFNYPGYFKLGINDKYFDFTFKATKGAWVGGRLGIYARGLEGSAKFKQFEVKETNDR